MNFGEALKLIKNGRRVAREGWNGRSMWLAYSPGHDKNPTENFWSRTVRNFLLQNKIDFCSVRPYIVMYTVQKDIVPWVASQTDLLAEDWFEVV
jgi:Protein of unknown function (DUF2829)